MRDSAPWRVGRRLKNMSTEPHVVFDGTLYQRLDDQVGADTPYSIRIQVGRGLTADEAKTLAAIAGYAYAKTGGERGNGYEQDSPNSIVFFCDTTKGRAYRKMGQFFDDVREMVVDGSPLRKRGENAGTRLVPGLGDVGEVTFYADDVYGSTLTEEQEREILDRDETSPWCEVDACVRYAHPCACGASHCEEHPCRVTPQPMMKVVTDPDGVIRVVEDSRYSHRLPGVDAKTLAELVGLLGFDERGFDSEGVHRNGTLLDDNGVDVTGERFGSCPTSVDPVEDRVCRTADGDVVKFTFRDKMAVSVQRLTEGPDGKPKWTAPRTTSTGAGLETLRRVTGLNAGARAVPESVAAKVGRATGRCLLCSRPLSDDESVSKGYGRDCAGKLYGK